MHHHWIIYKQTSQSLRKQSAFWNIGRCLMFELHWSNAWILLLNWTSKVCLRMYVSIDSLCLPHKLAGMLVLIQKRGVRLWMQHCADRAIKLLCQNSSPADLEHWHHSTYLSKRLCRHAIASNKANYKHFIINSRQQNSGEKLFFLWKKPIQSY